MVHRTSKIRKSNRPNTLLNRKLILRRHAERYILITLLTFALTVGATRLFLNITGFPQLGSGNLHISHVLWGGIFLFAAVILALTFINQRLFTLSAILSGIGVGLFIDEVGKFITSGYNYFVPAAAPIIYSLFLLTVLIYTLVVHRKRRDSRLQLYELLGDLEEILDEDYTAAEARQLSTRLQTVQKDPELRELKPIARGLEEYLSNNARPNQHARTGLLDEINDRWITFRNKYLTRIRLKSILIGSLLGISFWELRYPVSFLLYLHSPENLLDQLSQLVTSELVTGPVTIGLFIFRLGFNIILGCALLVAAFLFIINRDKKASATAYISLMVILTAANLVLFYFDQFSMIINACVQFLVLLATLYYRRKYLDIAL
jgi:hypothetical protein